MQVLNVNEVRLMLLYVADKIIENEAMLTKVDLEIGDGDHGIGMAIGSRKIKEQLADQSFDSINAVFKAAGIAMINSMGGASGVIFGTLFLGNWNSKASIQEMDLAGFAETFSGALNAIKTRGKAQPGDKTMVDALQPACESLTESAKTGMSDLAAAFALAEQAAQEGMEKTKEYEAKFGRSKSLHERAIGFQDAGATSVWIIFRSMKEWLERGAE